MRINAVNSRDITLTGGESKAAFAAVSDQAAVNSTQTGDKDIDRRLAAAAERLNKAAAQTNRQIRFAVHKDTHRVMLEVVDSKTNKVLATFPPTQILDMIASLESDGKLLDKKI